MSILKIALMIWLAGVLTCSGLTAGTSAAEAKSFRISAVQENQVWIEGGLIDGLEEGMAGEIAYEISVAGQKKRIVPAKARLSKVEDRESIGILVEQSGTVNVGYAAQFVPKASSELLLVFNRHASDAYTAKDFRLSKEYYQRILGILPGDAFALQKIKDCDAQLEKQDALMRERRSIPYYREVVRTSLKSDDAENVKLAQIYVEKILSLEPQDEESLKNKAALAQLAARKAAPAVAAQTAPAPAPAQIAVPPSKPVSTVDESTSRKTAPPVPVQASPAPSKPVPAVDESSSRKAAPREPVQPESKVPAAPAAVLKDMIRIPQGDYLIGSLPGHSPFENEFPRHQVHLAAFFIDRHEVTNEEYKEFCDVTGHAYPSYFSGKDFPAGTARKPVVMVNWTDADAYAKWAGKRLPTEIEWESAAAGPSGKTWPWGNIWIPNEANTRESGEDDSTGVGSHAFDVSEFGVLDMAGNVSEWTQDWYQPYPGNTRKEKEYGELFRVLRGGSSKASKDFARAQFRARLPASYRAIDLGFRCALSAKDTQ
jgi:formylglycine-generating enzyme required for sulfatase activity